MHTIAVISQKGGAGKTTLAVHIASQAAACGLVTLVIDTDPQATASRWAQWRGGNEPEVIDCGAPILLAAKLKKAGDLGAELVVIDTPPHADAMARTAARLADLILVPCRPRAFDLAAVEATADLVRTAGKPAFVVLNAGPPNAPHLYRETIELVEGTFGMQIAPVSLADRAAFHHATARGQTASQSFQDSKAAKEAEALWRWICEQMDLRIREPTYRTAHP